MANYILDTNHLSPLVTPGHRLRERVFRHLHRNDSFAIAAPALTELLFGIQIIPRAQLNITEWSGIRTIFRYYDLERRDAEHAATLQISLRRRGFQLHTIDALIAAVALRYDLILLTTDQDFNAIAGLTVENWLA